MHFSVSPRQNICVSLGSYLVLQYLAWLQAWTQISSAQIEEITPKNYKNDFGNRFAWKGSAPRVF